MRVNIDDAVQSVVIYLKSSDIRSVESVAVIPDCGCLIPGSKCSVVPPSVAGIYNSGTQMTAKRLEENFFYVHD